MKLSPTPEQRDIIEYPLLPLRVTAGAGTGKTTTMAMRLASKVRAGAVAAERTLGITFTNKAAEELADGVRRELTVESESEPEVEVVTYHGFAFGLVREFGPLVGFSQSVRVVTPGYVRQLLRDALGAAPRRHLDLTAPRPIIDRLLSLSSTLGDHLLDPGAIADVGTDDLRPTRREISEVLKAFVVRKGKLGVVDFGELVTAAHRMVAEHPEIAARIRSRYDLVLLDEYQDTNPGQRELLLALFGDGFPVTAVGDSDQTIYEWRGASPENFAAFPDHFRDADGSVAKSLALSTSWRSGQLIVDVANEIRSHISKRSPLTELLARDDAPLGVVRTHWLHSATTEAAWIADEVVRLHDEDGHAWKDIALLFRKYRQMAVIHAALVKAGIPVEIASFGGLLEVPEVADLLAWLRILAKPDNGPALARILLGSRYRLGLGDLAPLTRWVEGRRKASTEVSARWSLLEAVDDIEEVEGLDGESRRRLETFRGDYRHLLTIAQGANIAELCRRIFDRTGAWSEIDALPDAARVSTRLNTYRFLDLAENWSPLEGRPTLDAFLDHLRVLADDASAEELDTAQVSGENAVVLLTVHRAKGLEWPIVFLPALASGTFPSSVVSYSDPVSDADVLPYELRLDQDALPNLDGDRGERRTALRLIHTDGEWRTAYVAVTRAAQELVATGAWWYTRSRPKQRSRLFEAIDRLAERAPNRSNQPGDPPRTLRPHIECGPGPDPHFSGGSIAFLRASVSDPALPMQMAEDAGIGSQYDAAVDQMCIMLSGLPPPLESPPVVEPFRTSVTGLVTYATCPLRFRWEHIDRLPRKPSPAARRGTQLHRQIELHHRGTVAFDEVTPDFYDDVAATDETPPETTFDRFNESRFAATRPILIEAPFELRIRDGTLRGRIDAVYEAANGEWEIVDFKSGRIRNDPARIVQLEAYAVAAEEAGLDGRPPPTSTTVTFAYFGGSQTEEISEAVDQAWMERARTHLTDLMRGADDGPYDPEPGDICRFCDFARFCEAGAGWLEEHS